MKILKYLLVFFFSTFIFIYAKLFYPFVSGTLEKEFVIKDIAKDTTFLFQRHNKIIRLITKKNNSSSGGLPFTIHAMGEINNKAEVCVKYVGLSGNYYCFSIPLGKIDTLWHGELYEDNAEIVYLHHGTTTGKLNLVYKIGHRTK
jgi:hypothetical protein